MSTLTPEEEELLAWLKGSLPSWFWQKTEAKEEIWRGIVKAFGRVRDLINDWADRTFILYSDDVWLEQHAKDRGTSRQYGESDEGLQARLRTPLQAVVRNDLLDGITTLLAAHELTWTPNMIELRRDGAFFGTYVPMTGIGESLTVGEAGEVTLVDTVGTTFTGYEVGHYITITASTKTGNDGTFPITAVLGDGSIRFTNEDAVNETSEFEWSLDYNDAGYNRAYFNRGYRFHGRAFIIILPSTCSDAVVSSVEEFVRQRKAAGYVAVIERTPA